MIPLGMGRSLRVVEVSASWEQVLRVSSDGVPEGFGATATLPMQSQ